MSKDQASREKTGETTSGHPGGGATMAAPLPPWAPKDGAQVDPVDPPTSVIDEGQRAAAQLELSHILLPGERVTWACRPDPSSLWKHWVRWFFLELFTWFMIVGGIVVAISLVLERGALGIPFAVTAGITTLAFIIGKVYWEVTGASKRIRPWLVRRRLLSTWYAVTSKRVLLASGRNEKFELRHWLPGEIKAVQFTRNDEAGGAVVLSLEGLPSLNSRLFNHDERLPGVPTRHLGESGARAIDTLRSQWALAEPALKDDWKTEALQSAQAETLGRARPHLQSDESLLWTGKPLSNFFQGPAEGNQFVTVAVPAIVSAMLLSAVVYMFASNTRSSFTAALSECGNAFTALAILAPYFLTKNIMMRRRFAHTTYAVTDRRVMVITKRKDGKDNVESYLPETLCEPELLTQPDGVGRVVFRFQTPKPKRKPRGAKLGFEAIPEAHRAARAIRELHSRTQGSGAPWVEWPPKVQ